MESAQVRAKKGQGIDDVVRGLSPGVLDIQRQIISSVLSDEYQELFSAYESLLHEFLSVGPQTFAAQTTELVRDTNFPLTGKPLKSILSPVQINSFFIATFPYEGEQHYDKATGLFLTKLMQNSYYAGFNDFVLGADADLDCLGTRMQGTHANPIRIKFKGNIFDAASLATHVNLVVYGNVKWIGSSAKHCEFTLHGDYLELFRPQNCTIKTPNYAQAQIIATDLPEGNKVIYIQPDGQEQEVRR